MTKNGQNTVRFVGSELHRVMQIAIDKVLAYPDTKLAAKVRRWKASNTSTSKAKNGDDSKQDDVIFVDVRSDVLEAMLDFYRLEKMVRPLNTPIPIFKAVLSDYGLAGYYKPETETIRITFLVISYNGIQIFPNMNTLPPAAAYNLWNDLGDCGVVSTNYNYDGWKGTKFGIERRCHYDSAFIGLCERLQKCTAFFVVSYSDVREWVNVEYTYVTSP
jgi:hypothetical protein